MFEITVDEQTPVKVAINEAVELAKLFGSDSSRRFVKRGAGHPGDSPEFRYAN